MLSVAADRDDMKFLLGGFQARVEENLRGTEDRGHGASDLVTYIGEKVGPRSNRRQGLVSRPSQFDRLPLKLK